MLLTSSLNTEQLKASIEQKMHNSYIEKYVQTPEIDENKLMLLALLLKDADGSLQQKTNNIVAAMLVQMALDTHDLVPSTNDREYTASDIRKKQLSVLAGDYYSGLYYLLLSETEDIEMVHILAAAIKEINEQKMQLYYQVDGLSEDFLSIVKNIESLLFVYVAEKAGGSSLSEIIAEWLMVLKLHKERERFNGDSVESIYSVWNRLSIDDPERMLHVVEREIKERIVSLTGSLENTPVRFKEIREHIEGTINEFSDGKRSAAEEG